MGNGDFRLVPVATPQAFPVCWFRLSSRASCCFSFVLINLFLFYVIIPASVRFKEMRLRPGTRAKAGLKCLLIKKCYVFGGFFSLL